MNPNELMERYNTIINKVLEEQIAFLQNLKYVNSLLQKEQKTEEDWKTISEGIALLEKQAPNYQESVSTYHK